MVASAISPAGTGSPLDNLLSVDVVTADGQYRKASEDEDADLFWPLPGGGGNFGVATSLEFRVHPVKDVYVGIFFYEIDETANLLRFFREFITDAPEAYGGFPAFQVAPPLPFIPEDRHGDTFCAAIVHWAGPLEEGEQAMAPFRDLAQRVGEMVGQMPYPALNAAFDGLFPKGMRSYWKGSYVTELTDAAIQAHVTHGPNVPGVSATMHLYPINGAASQVGACETAFAYRDATFAPVIVAAWEDADDDEACTKWVRDYYQAIAAHSEPGGYINFMSDDDQGRIQDNYKGNHARLVDAKRTYDPNNLFRHNQNIKP